MFFWPFNQQMGFPVALALRTTSDGIRMAKWPVAELSTLITRERSLKNRTLKPGQNPLKSWNAELLDVESEIEPGAARTVTWNLRGAKFEWSANSKTLTAFSRSVPLAPINSRLRFRFLVDRSSVEFFGNDGIVTLSQCFLPRPDDQDLGLTCEGGSARIVNLKVRSLNSAWPR